MERQETFTPWFAGETKPVRRGVYQRHFFEGTDVHYSYWNGKEWGQSSFFVDRAFDCRKQRSLTQDAPWRGLRGDA